MLASASLAAPSCCLRCQLHQAISQARFLARPKCVGAFNRSALRSFKTMTSLCKEQAEEGQGTFLKSAKNDDRKREIYRRKYPLGRIVGQPGRRQRERSETLRIPAMQQPFDVVVLQDVKIPEHPVISDSQKANVDRNHNAKPEADSFYVRDGMATQEEVNASIEELRPAIQSVDQQTYEKLRDQMLRSYNRKQLSSYLVKCHPQSGDTRRTPPRHPSKHSCPASRIEQSDWRPVHTTSDTSVQSHNRDEKDKGKKRVVDEILRAAWSLTIETDESRIGELEMVLKPWQNRLLFRRNRNKRPNYEDMIQSLLLLRSSKIESRLVSNTIRITARRQVAEEIASLLKSKLLEMKRTDFDYSVFTPMLDTPGWPPKLDGIFTDSDLASVEWHTSCAIERKDGKTLYIYGQSDAQRQDAKRLLFSLLELPSPTYISEISFGGSDGNKHKTATIYNVQQNPETNTMDLPLRHRTKQLFRMAKPTIRSASKGAITTRKISQEERDSLNRRLIEKLNGHNVPLGVLTRQSQQAAAEELNQVKQHSGPASKSYWMETIDHITPWEAQLCRILQPYRERNDGRGLRKAASIKEVRKQHRDGSIIQSRVPGINSLLTYFAPKEAAFAFDEPGPTPPVLVAHFFPSPFTSSDVTDMRNLPRVQLRYDLIDRNRSGITADRLILRLSSMRATLAEQDLRIHLPEETADLRFVRQRTLEAKIDHVLRDSEINSFTKGLQQSLSSGTGALVGKPIIKIKLPALFVPNDAEERSSSILRNDVEYEYYFDHFEQIQTAEFVPPRGDDNAQPPNEDMGRVQGEMARTTVLRYRTVEGGLAGGRRTELAILDKATNDTKAEAHEDCRDVAKELKPDALVTASLDLVRCLTQINAGQLPPLGMRSV